MQPAEQPQLGQLAGKSHLVSIKSAQSIQAACWPGAAVTGLELAEGELGAAWNF